MPAQRETPAFTAPYRLKVALRLLRARKVNLISILGVTLGVAAIIIVMSVMDGFQLELRSMIRGTLSDLIVQIDPEQVGSYNDLRAAVGEVPGVAAVALQEHTFGAIPVENKDVDGALQNLIPLRIVGIVPSEEAKVSRVMQQMLPAPGHPDNPFEVNPDLLEGFTEEETPRVVISDWIARRIGHGIPIAVGEQIRLVNYEEVEGDDPGRPELRFPDRWVIVSRIYDSGNSEYDKLHIYVDLTSSGRVFFPSRMGTIVELRIKLKDYSRAEEVRGPVARVVARFDPNASYAPKWYVKTWEERQHNFLRAVNNEKFLLAFVLFFIVLVGCFTIFATLTMTVVEKTRDIGVLRALGATPGGILAIFVLNGTLVGVLGAALGYGLGELGAHNVNPIRNFLKTVFGWDIFPPDIYLFDKIPAHIDHTAALAFALGAALAALLAAIVPAVRAARLQPVDALRYE